MRILVEEGKADPMIGNDLYPSSFHCWTGAIDTYYWLRDQDYVYVNIAEASEEYGNPVYYSHLVMSEGEDVRVALKSLSQNRDMEEVLHGKNQHGKTLLYAAMRSALIRRLTYCYEHGITSLAHSFEGKLELSSKLVEHGSDIHCQVRRATLLSEFIVALSPLSDCMPSLPQVAQLLI